MAVLNTLNTKTHTSKELADFSSENGDVESICYCEQRMKSKRSLSSECVKKKLCKPCTTFTSHLHSSCGMVWYRTSTVKQNWHCLLRGWVIIPAGGSVSWSLHDWWGRNCQLFGRAAAEAQSQYTDTRPPWRRADPLTPGAWQGSPWSANFLSIWVSYGSMWWVEFCRPAILHGINFNIGHYMQTVPNFFTPAMLSHYQFTLLSLALTLSVGHTVSRKQNLLASFSPACHVIRMKFDVVIRQFKLNIQRLLLSKMYWKKGNDCFYRLCHKTLMMACVQMFMNGFHSNLVWS